MNHQKTLQEIEIEFENSVVIPLEKPKEQFFFCPVGLVGAGKTTVTKPISEKLNLVRLSSDELRKLLKENGYDYGAVKDIGLKIAKSLADEGYSLAFDMDCGNPQVKEFVESLASKLNAKVFFVQITSPEEFIFNKFRMHPPTWLADNPQIMIDNYFAQKETRIKEGTQFNFLYTFDTSKENLLEQIDECVSLIKEKLKNS